MLWLHLTGYTVSDEFTHGKVNIHYDAINNNAICYSHNICSLISLYKQNRCLAIINEFILSHSLVFRHAITQPM